MAPSSGGPATFEDVLKIDLTIFRSRLAKRFSAMFVTCALVPIAALTILSYYGVTNQLTDQASTRLRQSAKSHGLSIYEDLLLANNQLDIIETMLTRKKDGGLSELPSSIVRRNRDLFTGLAVLDTQRLLFTWSSGLPAEGLEKIRNTDLTGEASGLIVVNRGNQWPVIIIVRATKTWGGQKAYLAGVIKSSYLWGSDQGSFLPPASEYTVYDGHGQCLFRSLKSTQQVDAPGIAKRPTGVSPARGEVVIDGKRYCTSTWSMFLKPKFGVPAWEVTVMEPRDFVLEPLRYFNKIFPLILLLSLVIVAFLSYKAIGKSLVPIESLMEGAHRVANRRFDHRVVVKSKDELQDLADAFNRMADEIDAQFKVLAARSDLDRAILSVLDIEKIIATSLRQSNQLFLSRTAIISILDDNQPLWGRSYAYDARRADNIAGAVPFCLANEERSTIQRDAPWFHYDAGVVLPSYLAVVGASSLEHYLVLPIRIRDVLFGIVSFGTDKKITDSSDLSRIRAFCDHLSVAFSNANLLQELKNLNKGTLQALARAVDAKSHWTAGHSLRVTEMATSIAAAMGLPVTQMEDIERASLLHDIGKIGIRQSVLDKDGELTADEYALIKSHPSMGALILAPIQAYANIIPVVEQHHERFDGRGYPHGLSGSQIQIGARIIAVADSFDAMVSDRPYRNALGRQRAIAAIGEEAGFQFDPEVVRVFNGIMQRTDNVSHSAMLNEGFLLPSGQETVGQRIPDHGEKEIRSREMEP
jgi:putative nucleotidyltransferase with HDIG domain